MYLDDGRLYTPPTLTIPTLPPSTVEPLHRALARVLNPGTEFQDHLFGTGTQKLQVKSMELQVLFLYNTCQHYYKLERYKVDSAVIYYILLFNLFPTVGMII